MKQPAGRVRRGQDARLTRVMARASRVPLVRMRGDPDVSRGSSASHQNESRRTPLRGSRSSAPLFSIVCAFLSKGKLEVAKFI